MTPASLPSRNGELLVDAERAILVADRLGVLLAPVAGREDVDAHDLELRRLHGAGIGRPPVAGDRRRQHLALLEQRRDQPVADAAVLDALADGEDVGRRRLHVVVDDDAAVDVQRRPCTRGRRWAGCRRRRRPGRPRGSCRRRAPRLRRGRCRARRSSCGRAARGCRAPPSCRAGTGRRRDRAAAPSASASGARR